jgi:hypothetical protein
MLTLIGSGLTMVDEFYDSATSSAGQHSVRVAARGGGLVVADHGYEQEILAASLRLADFDRLRHDTLYARIKTNWAEYNSLDLKRSKASPRERRTIASQMSGLRDELCPDFRELVSI